MDVPRRLGPGSARTKAIATSGRHSQNSFKEKAKRQFLSKIWWVRHLLPSALMNRSPLESGLRFPPLNFSTLAEPPTPANENTATTSSWETPLAHAHLGPQHVSRRRFRGDCAGWRSKICHCRRTVKP